MSAATLAPPDPTTVTPPPKAILPGAASAPPVEADDPPYGGLEGLRRFTVAEYHAMLKAGVLADGERVELLNGFVVNQMSRGPDHDYPIRVLTKYFNRTLSDDWSVGPQTAATLGDDSEPEPDLSIARGPDLTYATRHPGPADIVLFVEVADASLRRDQREKLAVYAAAGVPVYWVVNVPQRQVEVYTRPAGDTYAATAVYAAGQQLPVVLDGVDRGLIAVADLFRRPQVN